MKKEVKKENKNLNNVWSRSFVIILALSFFLYGNTIKNNYNLDDIFVIKNNPQVLKGIKAIPEIFTNRYFENRQAKFGYRPLTKAVFAVEVSLFGVNPHISHFINIVLYAILVYVLLIWLKRIFEQSVGNLFIWAILLLWMFHPIHTEVVASLKNREEILYLMFAILSSLQFMNFIELGKFRYLILAVILYAISYLAKQSAISFVVMLPVLFYFKYIKVFSIRDVKNLKVLTFIRDKKSLRVLYSVIALSIIGYIMYKLPNWILPPDEIELFSFENPLRYDKAWASRFSVAALTLIYYIRLLIFPHPLLFYYGLYTLPEVQITDLIVWFSVTVHIGLLIWFIKLWTRNQYILLGYLMYLAAISPFSNYMMEINGIVADRFLHGPSIGFAMVLAGLLFLIFKTDVTTENYKALPKKLKYTFFIILVLYSIKTISRNEDWKDEMTLFNRDIQYLHNSVKANDILAQTIMDRIMMNNPQRFTFQQLKPSLDSVLRYFKRTIELFHNNPKAMNNIANLYLNFYNKPDSAMYYLQEAYKLKPQSFEITFNLGMAYDLLRNNTLAIRFYTKALEMDKSYPKLWHIIINYYFLHNNPDSAKYYAERMLKYDTISDVAYTSIGYYYLLQKDTATAVKYWEKAFERNPNNKQRAITLGQYFLSKKDSVKAGFYFARARALP